MTGGWWRRQRIPLISLVLATAAMLVVGVVVPAQTWQAQHRPARLVAAGSEARIGDVRLRLLKAGVFHPDGDPGVDVPRGAVILAVLIRVTTPSRSNGNCGVELVRSGSDPISWQPLTTPSTYRYGLSDDTVHTCSLDDASGARTLEQTFLVPESVYDHVTVSVQATPERGGTTGSVRLALPRKPYSDTAAG